MISLSPLLSVLSDSRLLKYIRKQQELDYKVEILTYKFNNESDCCYYSEKLNCRPDFIVKNIKQILEEIFMEAPSRNKSA